MLAVAPASTRRLTLVFLSGLLMAAAFAGCIGEDAPEPDAGLGVPAGCEDAVMATIDADRKITPANLTVVHPFTLCLTNDHAEPFTVKGMPNKLPKPDFVPLPSVIDPHAEHRGGGNVVAALPQMTLQPGATQVFTGITFHGLVMVHDAEDLDNNVVWEFIPETEVSYPIVQNQVILTGTGSGDTDAGSVGTHEVEVAVPDLERVRVTLKWDDSADDGTGGQATNGADTLAVRLIDPSGTKVAEKELEKREGEIKFEHTLEVGSFPETVTSQGLTNASAALETERPPDVSAVGTWKVEVAVLSAPGAAPDEDGSTKGVTGGDGHQAWEVTVQTIHKWAWPAVAGVEQAPDIVQAAY